MHRRRAVLACLRANWHVSRAPSIGVGALSSSFEFEYRSGTQTVMRYHRQLLSEEGEVTALLTTREGCIVLGTSRGAVVLLSPDPRRTLTARPNLASCDFDESL